MIRLLMPMIVTGALAVLLVGIVLGVRSAVGMASEAIASRGTKLAAGAILLLAVALVGYAVLRTPHPSAQAVAGSQVAPRAAGTFVTVEGY